METEVLTSQEQTEVLTPAEQAELKQNAARLRKMPSADVTTEWAYYDTELERIGQISKDDDATIEYYGHLVSDDRRKRDLCADELHRRKKSDTLPMGGAVGIAPDVIQDIKARVDLGAFIESCGVELKMRGRELVGLCPFHADTKPSLSVNVEKGLWYCFGCHVGGDVIAFAMRKDGNDFLTVLEELATSAKVELPKRNGHAAQIAESEPRAMIDAGDTWLPLADVLAAFHRGETGDAELLARLFADRVVFDHSENSWFLWNGQHWEEDRKNSVGAFVANDVAAQYIAAAATKKRAGGDEAEKIVKELYERAGGLRSRNKIGNVLALAASQPALALSGDEWDKDSLLLGVANGTLDLKTGELRASNPRDYIKTASPTEWRGLNECAPRWESFLQEIFAGDTALIAFVQRLFGYGITGLTTEHVFPVLWGEGRNGKDTLLETLRHVLGAYAKPVQSEVLLSSDRNPNAATPHLVALRGLRLSWVSETNEGARLNAGQVKLLTGGGTIAARPLYGNPVTFKPQYLLMLITNHKPHADADDYALWQRVLLIPFTQAFVDRPQEPNEHLRDPHLVEKLRGEAPGILAWFVRGCLDWQRQGLNPPESVRMATDEYRDGEDTTGQFISEKCVTASDAEVKASDLYDAYKTWATSNGLSPMSGTAFGRRMSRRFKKRTGARNTYIGVGLLENDKAAFFGGKSV